MPVIRGKWRRLVVMDDATGPRLVEMVPGAPVTDRAVARAALLGAHIEIAPHLTITLSGTAEPISPEGLAALRRAGLVDEAPADG